MMRHLINPLVDCVFKMLLGTEENLDLLGSFLNALLDPAQRIVELELASPITHRQTRGDDLTVVDVAARDSAGRTFQIEVQLNVHAWMAERVLYSWSDLYQGQLQAGKKYHHLRPVISVWIFDRVVFRDDDRYHHRFTVHDPLAGRDLCPHLEIHTIELPKWSLRRTEPLAPLEQWVYFLKYARGWYDLPSELENPQMRKAMSVMERWSEREIDYLRYRRRMDELRVQAAFETYQEQLEERQVQLIEETERLRQVNEAATRVIQDLEEERGRIASEISKAEAEKSRAEAEKSRIEAEKSQIEAEKSRVEAEKSQIEAEKSQIEAEKSRVEAEKSQIEVEKSRVEAEKSQIEAEKSRVEAEKSRIEAEKSQIEAEKSRVEAEKSQIEAENQILRERLAALGVQLPSR